jgi:hypothetical protein
MHAARTVVSPTPQDEVDCNCEPASRGATCFGMPCTMPSAHSTYIAPYGSCPGLRSALDVVATRALASPIAVLSSRAQIADRTEQGEQTREGQQIKVQSAP